MCVRSINFASFYDLLLDFGTVPTLWYFLFLFLFHNTLRKNIFIWPLPCNSFAWRLPVMTYGHVFPIPLPGNRCFRFRHDVSFPAVLRIISDHTWFVNEQLYYLSVCRWTKCKNKENNQNYFLWNFCTNILKTCW